MKDRVEKECHYCHTHWSLEVSHWIQPTPKYKCCPTSSHPTPQHIIWTQSRGGLAASIPLVNHGLQLLTSNQDYQSPPPSGPKCKAHIFRFLSSLGASSKKFLINLLALWCFKEDFKHILVKKQNKTKIKQIKKTLTNAFSYLQFMLQEDGSELLNLPLSEADVPQLHVLRHCFNLGGLTLHDNRLFVKSI